MRISIVLAILALFFTLLASHYDFAYAQATDSASSPQPDSADVNLEDWGTLNEAGAVDIGESLIHPASPLYFLKAIREKIEKALSSTRESQAIREVEFAQRRLREVNALVRNKNQDLIPPTLERYKAHLQEAEGFASYDESLAARVGAAVSRHLDVLQRVYDQVGHPRAKAAMRAAIERAEEYNRKLVEKLNLVEQQQLIRKVALRQALACKFFEREASSSALNDTERGYLKGKVKECKQNIRENLKDELQEIKQRRMEFRLEGKRPGSTPSATQ